MPRKPNPDTTPRPRSSRGKSGKPPAPPPETRAGTPDTQRRGKGFAEAPQAPFIPRFSSPAPRKRAEERGQPHGAEQASAPHPNPLPASGERESRPT
ncbi:MAG: hypothetical protein ACM3ZB_03680, partial [bacterium]